MLYFMVCFGNLLKFGYWPTLDILNSISVAPILVCIDILFAVVCLAGAIVIDRLEGVDIDDFLKALKKNL